MIEEVSLSDKAQNSDPDKNEFSTWAQIAGNTWKHTHSFDPAKDFSLTKSDLAPAAQGSAVPVEPSQSADATPAPNKSSDGSAPLNANNRAEQIKTAS